MARDIALFGLSANPPTGSTGHVGIIRALAAGGSFDEVWVAPVYIHIYASKSNMAPYADRIAMCKLCFEPESTEQCSVVVLDIEREVFEWTAANTGGGGGSGNTTGTIDVIMYIKQKHTDVNIHLILGGDTFQDLAAGKWKDSERYG